MLLPACQTYAHSGISGWIEKWRMGPLICAAQVSYPPKMAEEAREKNPSFFKVLLKRCLTLHSLSLYSTTIICPLRQPMMNSAAWMDTEAVAGLMTSEVTCMVAMIFLGMMSVSGMVEVISLVISFLSGQTQSTAQSELQSAAMMKLRSGVSQVPEMIKKGQQATLYFFISHLVTNLVQSLSIILLSMDQGDMLGKVMHMSIAWNWDIAFIFQSWTVLQDQAGLLVLGLALSVLASMLSVALPAVKSKITRKLFRKTYKSTLLLKDKGSVMSQKEEEIDREQSSGEIIFGFFYIFIYSLLHIATMMLIMTYNGYVVLAVLAGLALGFAIFGMECDKDKNVPVNCCA